MADPVETTGQVYHANAQSWTEMEVSSPSDDGNVNVPIQAASCDLQSTSVADDEIGYGIRTRYRGKRLNPLKLTGPSRIPPRKRNIKMLTERRKKLITLFLKRTILNPDLNGIYGSKQWTCGLIKALGERNKLQKSAPTDVKWWLHKNGYFKDLLKQITAQNQECGFTPTDDPSEDPGIHTGSTGEPVRRQSVIVENVIGLNSAANAAGVVSSSENEVDQWNVRPPSASMDLEAAQSESGSNRSNVGELHSRPPSTSLELAAVQSECGSNGSDMGEANSRPLSPSTSLEPAQSECGSCGSELGQSASRPPSTPLEPAAAQSECEPNGCKVSGSIIMLAPVSREPAAVQSTSGSNGNEAGRSNSRLPSASKGPAAEQLVRGSGGREEGQSKLKPPSASSSPETSPERDYFPQPNPASWTNFQNWLDDGAPPPPQHFGTGGNSWPKSDRSSKSLPSRREDKAHGQRGNPQVPPQAYFMDTDQGESIRSHSLPNGSGQNQNYYDQRYQYGQQLHGSQNGQQYHYQQQMQNGLNRNQSATNSPGGQSQDPHVTLPTADQLITNYTNVMMSMVHGMRTVNHYHSGGDTDWVWDICFHALHILSLTTNRRQ